MARKLAADYKARLDAVFKHALDNDTLNIPGFVAMCRRGGSVYGPKAFGFADLEGSKVMEPDALMRMYSMTKVLTSALALMLYEKGLFKLNDPVGAYLPSFDREWTVVREADQGRESPLGEVDIYNMALGTSSTVKYSGVRANNVMRIKHLMTETSGIGYDLWGDFDEMLGHELGTKRAFHVANALRARVHPNVYKSSCILGQDLTLEEFCDAIAEAGALATEPGQFSYGLGAAVLGRVIEVVYEEHGGSKKKLSGIFEELLFRPLGMQDAAFFLDDGDPRVGRIPTLCGVKVDEDSRVSMVPAAESVAPTDPPYSNGTDHVSGPRKQESGDTGTLMTVEDYGRFLDFVARGGITASGERLLSAAGAYSLTRKWIRGLDLDTGLARFCDCAGTLNASLPKSFQFGWAITNPSPDLEEYQPTEHPAMCRWSGYANSTVHYFRDEDAWIVIAPQVMCHGLAGKGEIYAVLTKPALETFLDLWR
jgi:CubicO group peptidase (beta-lactamase class C family)